MSLYDKVFYSLCKQLDTSGTLARDRPDLLLNLNPHVPRVKYWKLDRSRPKRADNNINAGRCLPYFCTQETVAGRGHKIKLTQLYFFPDFWW